MNVGDYFGSIGRKLDFWVDSNGKYKVSSDGDVVKGGACFGRFVGKGDTQLQALNDYTMGISGKVLVFRPDMPEFDLFGRQIVCQTYQVPMLDFVSENNILTAESASKLRNSLELTVECCEQILDMVKSGESFAHIKSVASAYADLITPDLSKILEIKTKSQEEGTK